MEEREALRGKTIRCWGRVALMNEYTMRVKHNAGAVGLGTYFSSET